MKKCIPICAVIALGLGSAPAQQDTANPNATPVVPPVKPYKPPGTPANPNSIPVNPPINPAPQANPNQAQPQNPFTQPQSVITSTQFQGAEVRNLEGEVIGTISQFLFNSNTGQAEAAVINAGGFLGVHSREVVVPFRSLSRQSTEGQERTYYSLETTREKLQAAPQYRASDRDQLNSSARMNEVYNYWGVERPAPAPNSTNPVPPGQTAPNGPSNNPLMRNQENQNSTITVPPSSGQGSSNNNSSGNRSSSGGNNNPSSSGGSTSGGSSPNP